MGMHDRIPDPDPVEERLAELEKKVSALVDQAAEGIVALQQCREKVIKVRNAHDLRLKELERIAKDLQNVSRNHGERMGALDRLFEQHCRAEASEE